ncbi:MAG: cytochrome ubiquinol oxidase subunit I [Propionibacteriaceae bacterium]|nr:cytochrome ubiquinol oxidase subunit I [Propionibacteriaceae bacterium]
MSPETIARWQFGITTVYHYFFVPVTIALSLMVAVMQTKWYRSGDEKFLRLTKFFGKLFLINFAMGVVTGIVQEFQFGMNWSEYSRFVGDIFGAPLALEALLAFFLESTFLGLWIFGWDKLPKKLHLMAIWLAAIGTMLSAVFILAANSFMQNPVGATYNPLTDRAEMTDFIALLTNPVFLATFPHTLAAAYMTAGGFVLAVSGWHLARLNKANRTDREDADVSAYRWSAKFSAWILIISGALVILTGDFQGKIMYQVQPMKMAAAEALYETAGGNGEMAPFSLLTIGTLDGSEPVFELQVPGVLGLLAKGDPYAEIAGIRNLQEQYAAELDAGQFNLPVDGSENALQAAYADKLRTVGVTNFVPNIPVSYWTFRIMMTLGFIAMAIGAWTLFTLRKGGLPKASPLWNLLMLTAVLAPLFGNSAGWIFAEMGRQPWIVAGVLPTASAVSPGVSAGEVFATMVLYTLIYGALAVVEVGLMTKYVKAGLPSEVPPVEIKGEDDVLSFAY